MTSEEESFDNSKSIQNLEKAKKILVAKKKRK
jgi:hypothetical protein